MFCRTYNYTLRGVAQIDSKEKDDKSKIIVGIGIISSIVNKVKTSDPSEILAALKQILYFYRLIPTEWKNKAYYIFSRLWDKNKVVISTEPDKAGNIYEVDFKDDRIKELYKKLPQMDQAILLQGKSMLDLIGKGLHSDSDEIKRKVEFRYGQRGLNIVNMLTTRDIEYVLDELEDELEVGSEIKRTETIFNRWSSEYDSISLLISPLELEKIELLKQKILDTAKQSTREFILINLSGKLEECTKLLQFILSLKDEKILKYKDVENDILESGFCKSLRIKINFE